ncbi:hypothetical protein RJ55_02796 [Drechmeria coniospora]|nr:hypothetical protein RJ55_02796 [Drechmeria coniospora]
MHSEQYMLCGTCTVLLSTSSLWASASCSGQPGNRRSKERTEPWSSCWAGWPFESALASTHRVSVHRSTPEIVPTAAVLMNGGGGGQLEPSSSARVIHNGITFLPSTRNSLSLAATAVDEDPAIRRMIGGALVEGGVELHPPTDLPDDLAAPAADQATSLPP